MRTGHRGSGRRSHWADVVFRVVERGTWGLTLVLGRVDETPDRTGREGGVEEEGEDQRVTTGEGPEDVNDEP